MFGLAGLVGDSIGSNELRDWGLAGYERNQQEATAVGPRLSSLSQIDDIGDFFDFASGAVGQAVPSLVASAGSGGAGGFIGATVAKRAATRLVEKGVTKKAAEAAIKRALNNPALRARMMSAVKVGSGTGAFLGSAGQQQGDLFGSLKAAGIEDAALPAWAFGAAMGALDVIPEFAIAKKLLPGQVEKQLTESIARGVAKTTTQQAALEGATEGAQSAIGSLARIVAGGADWNDEDTQALLDSMAAGAIVGTVVGAPTELASRARQKLANGKKNDRGQSDRQKQQPATQTTQSAPPPPPAAPAGTQAASSRTSDVSPQSEPSSPPRELTQDQILSVLRPPAPSAQTPAPTAQPTVDITAELRDLADDTNPRKGVYLSRDNLERHGINPGALANVHGLSVLGNVDGQEGVLLAKPIDRAAFMKRRRAGEPIEQLLGEFTRAGLTKPQTNNPVVVQERTPEGAVAAEGVVDGNDPVAVSAAIERFSTPGRTAEVVTPQDSIARREQLIAQEQTSAAQTTKRAPVQSSLAFDISIPGMDEDTQRYMTAARLESMLPPNEVGRRTLQWVLDSGKVDEFTRALQSPQGPYAAAASAIEQAFDLGTNTADASNRLLHLAQRNVERLLRIQEEANGETGAEDAPAVSESEDLTGLTQSDSSKPIRLIGTRGTIHGARMPGGAVRTATPWTSQTAQEDAERAARELQAKDEDAMYAPLFADATYVEEYNKDAGPSDRITPGWYVAVYPAPAGELVSWVSGNGAVTPYQASQIAIARGAARWDRLKESQKRPGSKGHVHGFRMIYLNKPAGHAKRVVHMASTEVVALGQALNPELRRGDVLSLREAFRAGLAQLQATHNLIPLDWANGKTTFSARLLLRDEYKRNGKVVEAVTLRDAAKAHAAEQQRIVRENVRGRDPSSPAFAARQRELYADTEQTNQFLGEVDPSDVDTGIRRVGPDRTQREHAGPMDDFARDLTRDELLELEQEMRYLADRASGADFTEDAGERYNRALAEINRRRHERSRGSGEFLPPIQPEPENAIPLNERASAVDPAPNPTPEAFDTEEAQAARQSSQRSFQADDIVGTTRDSGNSVLGVVRPGQRSESTAAAEITDNGVIVRLGEGDENRKRALVRKIHQWTDAVTALRRVMGIRNRLIVADSPADLAREAMSLGHRAIAEQIASTEQHRAHRGKALPFGFAGHFNGVSYIYLSPQLVHGTKYAAAFKVLAHELGHVFFQQHWNDNVDPQLRKDMYDAFLRDKDAGKKTANRVMDSKGRPMSAAGQFEEWFADQIASWVSRREAPRNAVEQFFQELANLFKRIWDVISAQYDLDESVETFIERAIRQSTTIDPAFDSLGEANRLMYDTTAPIEEPPRPLRAAWSKARAFKAKHRTLSALMDNAGASIAALHEGLLASLHARFARMKIPAFDEIIAHFHLRPGQQGGLTYHSEVAVRLRNFVTQFDAVVAGVNDEAALLEELRAEKPIEQIKPELRERVTKFRQLMRRLYDYQREAHLPVREVQDYFPQIADIEQLLMPDVVDTIYGALRAARLDITREQVTEWVANMSDDSLAIDFDPGKLEDTQGNLRSPFHQSLRTRAFSPEVRAVIRSIKDDQGRSRFYAKDLRGTLYRYITQTTKRAEFNRRFGDVDWDSDANQAIGERARRFDPYRQFSRLMADAREQGATPDQQRLMFDAMSAFLGQYNRIQSDPLRRLTRSMMLYQNVRTLLFVVFSSVPEFATLFLRAGNFGRAWSVIRASARDAISNGRTSQSAKLLRLYGFAVDQLDALAFDEFKQAKDYNSKLDRANEAWFRMTGLTRWTNFMRGLSLNVSLDYIKDHASRVAEGLDASGDSLRRLQELGLSVSDVAAWAVARQPVYGQAGVTHEALRTDLTRPTPRTDLSKEQLDAIQRVTGAVTRMINEIVVNPTAAMKPLWRSDEHFALLGQLGSFTYGFLNQVLSRVWHELTRDGATTQMRVQVALSVALMLPLVALGIELRELFQYRLPGFIGLKSKNPPATDDMSVPQYLGTLISRAGLTGIAQLSVDATSAAMSNKSPLLSFMGPTLGQVSDAFTQPVYKTVPGAIPFIASVPGMRDPIRAGLKELGE